MLALEKGDSYICPFNSWKKHHIHCTYNVTQRRYRGTIVAMKNRNIFFELLSYICRDQQLQHRRRWHGKK